MLYLEKIKLEGFRGVNKPLTLELDKNINILYGPNGAGKSSVVQAIQWCLTGKIPYFSGGDFTKEDALVNMFIPNRESSITLYFMNEDKSAKITRTRAMKSTSSPGTQPLTVEVEDQTLKGKQAEKHLADMLQMDFEEVTRSIVLHQEQIKEILSVKPSEQTKAIESLLGTEDIKAFAEALDPKRQIQTAKADLNRQVEVLERDKVQFTISLRNRLEEKKRTMLSTGYSEAELSVASAVKEAEAIVMQVNGIAASLSAETPQFAPIQPSIRSVSDCVSAAGRSIDKLERDRVDSLAKIQAQISNLQRMQNQYEMAVEQIQEMDAPPTETLQTEKITIDEQLSQLRTEKTKVERILSSLSTNRLSVITTNQKLADVEKELSTIYTEFGTPEAQARLISELKVANAAIDGRISNVSAKNQLVGIAIEYLEKEPVDACPVCSQTIDVKTVTNNLKTLVKDELRQEISSLRQTRKENETKIDALKRAEKEISRLTQERILCNSSLEKSYLALSQLLETKIDNTVNLDTLYSNHEAKSNEINQNIFSLSNRASEINSTILRCKQLEKTRDGAAEQVRKELGLQSDSPVEEKLSEAIQSLSENKKPFEITGDIDEARNKVSRLKSAMDYLQEQSQLVEMENDLPRITDEVKALRTNLEKLDLLGGQLRAIREAVVQYEKETVQTVVSTLEDEVNRFYSSLVGHPYFSKLVIEIENEFPLQYAFRATNPTEGTSTSISTRFSQAQMNAAAIAIFLSNNKKMKGELPLLILDDPTLSMDDSHKEKLAKLLSTVCSSRQIIIATHDKPFTEFAKQHAAGATIIEFKDWDKQGPEI